MDRPPSHDFHLFILDEMVRLSGGMPPGSFTPEELRTLMREAHVSALAKFAETFDPDTMFSLLAPDEMN